MNPVFGLAFDPDGRRLASGSSDKTIALWEVPSLNRIPKPLAGYASNAYSIAFHPGGELLAAGLADGTVALWNVPRGSKPTRDVRGAESGKALPPSRVGTVLALGGSSSAAFSPTGDIVVAAANMTLHAWKSATGEPVQISDPSRQVTKVAFSPADAGTLATAGCANWNREEQRCTRGEIQFWDAAGWRRLGPPVSAHAGWLTIAFHPDGRTLVSAGRDDGRVVFWDVATQKPGPVISIPGRRIFATAFSPDGRLLATGTSNGVILWDSATRQQIGVVLGDGDPVLTAAFSPDGTLLAWAGRNSDISVWEVGSERPRRRFSKHRSWVHSIAFSPDGRTLASGSVDERIVLWDVESGEPKGLPLAALESVSAVAFSPDGNTLLSGTYDGSLALWHLGIDSLRAGACEVAGRNLTPEEWRRYFRDEPYHPTCAQNALRRADFETLNGNAAAASQALKEAMEVGLAEGNAYVNNSILLVGQHRRRGRHGHRRVRARGIAGTVRRADQRVRARADSRQPGRRARHAGGFHGGRGGLHVPSFQLEGRRGIRAVQTTGILDRGAEAEAQSVRRGDSADAASRVTGRGRPADPDRRQRDPGSQGPPRQEARR